MPNKYRWQQILEQYSNEQNLISLLLSTSYVELAKKWNCSVDSVYTLRKKLHLGQKRTDIDEFLSRYSKEQLEDLYYNKYNRHLKIMAVGLDIYQVTLSKIFKQLGIEQKPHHVSEYPEWRKKISEVQKEIAKSGTLINYIIESPDWHENGVKVRKQKGSYTSPEYRAKISKKHVEVLERGGHKFKNTDIELLLQKELKKRKIKFVQDKGLIDLTVPDMFIEPNIAVYADGDYWHSLPKALVKDKYINEGLRRANYKVFRFTGTEIKKDVKTCVDQIEAHINEQKI